MAEHRVAGDGVELAVHAWGDPADPTVVLVHGFPDTHAVWEPVAAALVDHGFHVVAHNVRGAGASEAPADLDAYRLDHLVADLLAVVDWASPDAPVHLVGHDWGSIQSWQALGDPRLDGRLATYTSVSGLPLDHAGRWVRARLRDRSFLTLARQTLRSSYVAVFHLPGVQRAALRGQAVLGRARRPWGRGLQRIEGARTDVSWPAPTFGRDVARGMSLYRANFRDGLLRPAPARPSAVPVLLVLPTRDRFVPEWLFEGIEAHATDVRRRHVRAFHWGAVRGGSVDLAAWIAQHAAEHAAEPAAAEEVPAP